MCSSDLVPFTINADGTTTGLDGTTPTAVAFLGDLRGNETLKAHMGLRAPQAKSGDVFANRISRNEEYSDATASTVSRSISGVVWNDSDRDGIRESGEAPLAGPKVQLLKKTGSTWAVALDDAGNEIYVDAGIDVTIQDQIMKLIEGLKKRMNMSVILVTHDLGVVSQMCDRVAVMYAGHVMELCDTVTLFFHPRHPYTHGLFRSLPHGKGTRTRLKPIAGAPPSLENLPVGCPFEPRCDWAEECCRAG